MSNYSAPQLRTGASVTRLMLTVCAALLPGMAGAVWFFGVGVLAQVTICVLAAVLFEAAALTARGRGIRDLADGSALVTGMLLGLSLPATAPWWIAVFGAGFAIIVAKQLYGGLGYNPFNPAMAGYAALLISFPLQMTIWPLPEAGLTLTGIGRDLTVVFGGAPLADASTGATALDTLRVQVGLGRDAESIRSTSAVFGELGGRGVEWVAVGFLAGGLFLAWRRALDWRIPLAMLTTLFVLSGLFHLVDPATHAPPALHLFSGASMLGAFFIATDPVSAAATPRGRLWFGAGVGALTWLIRGFGGYPDGVAFAVLLMNMTVPMIDRWTQPKVFGRR